MDDESNALYAEAARLMAEAIDMVLHCPKCGMQHIDALELNPYHNAEAYGAEPEPKWTNPPHRSHKCHDCGHIWRPADVCTNGVAAIQTVGKDDSPTVRAGSTENMAWVTKNDANAYCRILSVLGMEEEGDPVAAVERLIAEADELQEAIHKAQQAEPEAQPAQPLTEAQIKAEFDRIAAEQVAAERVRCAEYLMQQAGLCPHDSACRAVLESAAGVVRLYGPAAA